MERGSLLKHDAKKLFSSLANPARRLAESIRNVLIMADAIDPSAPPPFRSASIPAERGAVRPLQPETRRQPVLSSEPTLGRLSVRTHEPPRAVRLCPPDRPSIRCVTAGVNALGSGQGRWSMIDRVSKHGHLCAGPFAWSYHLMVRPIDGTMKLMVKVGMDRNMTTVPFDLKDVTVP